MYYLQHHSDMLQSSEFPMLNSMEGALYDEWDENTVATIFDRNPEEADFGRTVSVICEGCGTSRYLLHLKCDECESEECEGFLIHETSKPFVQNPGLMKNREWFHATIRENWLQGVQEAEIPVHLGMEETSRWVGNRSLYGKNGYWLHKVRLKTEANIAPWFCPDLTEEWSKTSKELPADFVGYVNAYEAPGHASLYGNPDLIEMVSSEWIAVA